MSNTAQKARKNKEAHPEFYCPDKKCLWRTGDGSRCPRHRITMATLQREDLLDEAREVRADITH